jgi:hypothetical protein
MDERGLWNLFFATGLPLVWLAIRQEREEERAVPAVREEGSRTVEI